MVHGRGAGVRPLRAADGVALPSVGRAGDAGPAGAGVVAPPCPPGAGVAASPGRPGGAARPFATGPVRRLGVVLLLWSLVPAVGAQDWSGASLRGARPLALAEGYRLDVVAEGLRLPQGLDVDPQAGVWMLVRGHPGGQAGTLRRIGLDGVGPVDGGRDPGIPIPFVSATASFAAGSLARDPRSGELFVAEARGRHVLRVSPQGQVTLFARGAAALAEARALAFDADGRLLVLDLVGRASVADPGTDPLRELLGGAELYQGPVVYALRVDEPLPLPRNLEHAAVRFPPPAIRRQARLLPRYRGLVALRSGALVAHAPGGVVDRLDSDGAAVPVARLTGADAMAVGPRDELYVADHLGGRLVRVAADGTLRTLVEGLARPAALAVLPDATLLVAEDTGRLLRIRPPG